MLVASAWPDEKQGEDPTTFYAFVGLTTEALVKLALTGVCSAGRMHLPNGNDVRIALFTAEDEADLRQKANDLARTLDGGGGE